LLVLALPVTR